MDDRFAFGDLATLSVNRDEHRLVERSDEKRRQVFLGSPARVAGLALLEAGVQRRLAVSCSRGHAPSRRCAPAPRAAAGVDRRLAAAEFCSYIRAVRDCQYSNTISRKNDI